MTKKLQVVVFGLLLLSISTLDAQTYVASSNFENYLETHDADGNSVSVGDTNALGNGNLNDHIVVTSKIATVTNLIINDFNIDDLTGIEDFTNLEHLECTNYDYFVNVAGSLGLSGSVDLSNNTHLTYIDIHYNHIPSLNVSGLTALEHLSCHSNQLTSLDISSCTALTYLHLSGNQLTALDVSHNNALVTLECQANQLTSLDVSNLTALYELRCANPNLGSLNLGTISNINTLMMSGSSLTSLDVSHLTGLAYLYCEYNNIVSLNLNNNSSLYAFKASHNDLTELSIKNNNNTHISTFDTRNNYGLTCIEVDDVTYATNNWTNVDAAATFSNYCGTIYMPDDIFEAYCEYHDANGNSVNLGDANALGNGVTNDDSVSKPAVVQVTNLDISGLGISDLTGIEFFYGLVSLNASNNSISNGISFQENTALESLNLNDNYINTIDLSQNIHLEQLNAKNNLINQIDVSDNTLLTTLDLYNNYLTEIDVSYNDYLELLNIGNNFITNSLDLSTHYDLVNVNVNINQLTSLDLRNGYNTILTSFDATENSDLTCIFVDNATNANAGSGSYASWLKDAATNYVETAADCNALAVDDAEILKTNYTLYPNPFQEILSVKAVDSDDFTISIYSVLGKELIQSNSVNGIAHIDTSSLATGTYLVTILTDKKFISYKIIKE